MTYERFRATVESMLDEVPGVFLQDLQGVHALRDVKVEEGYRDVYRMGEYLDPGPDDFLGGAEGLGRHVALYWGSFRRIAQGDREFDWEEEIWETLTHELQHHVESLAGDGRLIEEDLLEAQRFERADGPSVAEEDDRHDGDEEYAYAVDAYDSVGDDTSAGRDTGDEVGRETGSETEDRAEDRAEGRAEVRATAGLGAVLRRWLDGWGR